MLANFELTLSGEYVCSLVGDSGVYLTAVSSVGPVLTPDKVGVQADLHLPGHTNLIIMSSCSVFPSPSTLPDLYWESDHIYECRQLYIYIFAYIHI